jgi:hypothetical protein
MDENGSSKWPLWLIILIVLGAGTYLGVILFNGGLRANLISMVFDLALAFVLFQLWLVFFSQFILPVQTFEDRRKIHDRLVAYLGGTRGPAIFVRDGQIVADPEELHRRGPGVIWLDTASAAVTRVGASFKNVFGPGVNFTQGNEYITADDVLDLHIQVHKIGPGEEENPFETEEGSAAEKDAIQGRGLKVSGLTRDGIEVIPSIEVVFRLDTSEVKKGDPGSLFGYSKDREREKADKKAIERAVLGQAINPNQLSDTAYYQVAWNQLPAYLAADLWREFLSKFRLDQLFRAEIVPPRLSPPASEIKVPEKDLTQLSNPVQAGPHGFLEDTLTGMLHGINVVLKGYTGNGDANEPLPPDHSQDNGHSDVDKKTALEIINLMVEQRLTRESAPMLNREGAFTPGKKESREFKLLKERGIRVLGVTIGDLKFSNKVEERLESNWTANWLANARTEETRLKTRQSFAVISGQQQAMWKYALDLSRALNQRVRNKSADLKDTAKILLMRSRDFLVRNDRVHHSASKERETLEEIIQWVETDSK